MLIGVDWGGTKLEIIALNDAGETLVRERVNTPRDDYEACVRSVVDLVAMVESRTGLFGSVGIGIPGTISPATGLVKNANSTWMNGKALVQDMIAALARDVCIQNDANCFAVSESVDGAGAGKDFVAGIILGTGCGAGLAFKGEALTGRQGIAGEFGHTPLPHMTMDEFPGNVCWCGRRGCLETYISGTGFERDYETRLGHPSPLRAEEVLAFNDDLAVEAYHVFADRLARGLSTLINIVDPDIIVLGGGMSNVMDLYDDVVGFLPQYVFSDFVETPIVRAKHGDSSGVRGAAWLWR